MLYELKRFRFDMQMQKFVTSHLQRFVFYMHSTSQVRHPNLKCSNLSNPTFSMIRLINTDSLSLPQLMWRNDDSKPFAFLRLCISYVVVRSTIDKKFRMTEFIRGAQQAVTVISSALATKNFESLNGLIKEKAFKVLKRSVNNLTPYQLDLLKINDSFMYTLPMSIQIKKTSDIKEKIVAIEVSGLYLTDGYVGFISVPFYGIGYTCVFERRYKNGIGGEWVTRIVNYKVL